jgi:hypothetical protein
MHRTLPALLALLLWSVTSSAQVSPLAGPVINPANGHAYYLLPSASWTNSEAQAVSLGGHLATVNDAAENAWIAQTFSRFGGQDRPLWIGLTDREVEGKFVWVNGEPATSLKWNTESGEPNNSAGSGYEEDFTYMIESNAGNSTLIPGQWNDAPDSGFGVNHNICGVVEVVPGGAVTPAMGASSISWGRMGVLLVAGAAALLVLLIGGVLVGVILWREKKAKDAGRR